MTGIPYIERRRQKLYLRVRIPSDLRPFVGKEFFTKSLKTAAPRRARGEAASRLAALHSAWTGTRQDVLRIAGKRLDELTGDDVPTLRRSDLDGLTDDERAAVLERLELLVEREGPRLRTRYPDRRLRGGSRLGRTLAMERFRWSVGAG